MVFSSLTFLFFFLPAALLLYYLSPRKWKNGVLLAASLCFYAWGEPIYILLMVFSACTDYFHGLWIDRYRLRRPVKAKLALISSIIVNIGVLSFFKYADFLMINLNLLLGTEFDPLQLPLPIGISFYTFQTMSYTIDVYRGQVKPQKNPIALATYVSLFPQLIAGPIVRYKTIAEELEQRRWNTKLFAEGVQRFILGLGKKVLIANNIGMLWHDIQSQQLSELTVMTTWLGIIAFALQIFFDFSGYSDMAIGLGKMFGFNFPENFNYPYISRSITEFWRRWHMTLGSWFRDYVYIPLGGSRVGKWKLYRNLFIVWGLTGLWHGASWNFALWGLYFGILIVVEKAALLKLLEKLHPAIGHIYLIITVLFGWVLFAFEDGMAGLHYIQAMLGMGNIPWADPQFVYYLYTNAFMLSIAVIASTPMVKAIWCRVAQRNNPPNDVVPDSGSLKEECQGTTEPGPSGRQGWFTVALPLAYYAFILLLSTAYLVDESFNPFLYFRF